MPWSLASQQAHIRPPLLYRSAALASVGSVLFPAIERVRDRQVLGRLTRIR